MTCRELIEFLSEYLDGRLSADVRAAFQEHLDECPNCVNFLNTYKSGAELARRVHSDETCQVPEELVKAILASRPK